MSHRLDELLIVDIATTCWLGPPPPGEKKEIIEIAVCPLNIQTGTMAPGRSLLVRPHNSRISTYCEEVTGLSAGEVQSGMSLSAACNILEQEFQARERVWASYGNTVRRRLKLGCQDRAVRYPFGSSHINIKTLVALMRGLQREVSLGEAMRLFNQSGSAGKSITMNATVNGGLLLARLLLESRVKYFVGVN